MKMSELIIEKTVQPTLVIDEGTRSFVTLKKYLTATSMPLDDLSLPHDWYPLYVSYQRELKV